jgi:hypothetical protein
VLGGHLARWRGPFERRSDDRDDGLDLARVRARNDGAELHHRGVWLDHRDHGRHGNHHDGRRRRGRHHDERHRNELHGRDDGNDASAAQRGERRGVVTRRGQLASARALVCPHVR